MTIQDTETVVPVLASLADEFAIMDRFFASHPGPTWPNRLFTLCGTSAGLTVGVRMRVCEHRRHA
jgi:phospholipase C